MPLTLDPAASPERDLAAALTALAGTDGEPARRAAAALRRTLRWTATTAWSDVAWCASELTAPGLPVELGFSTLKRDVRWTAEPTGPEQPASGRLAAALELMADLGAPPPPSALRAEIERLQGAGALRWGAWVSGRHSHGGDRFKLYAELPRAVTPRELLAMPDELTAQARALRAVPAFAGIEPASGRTEVYYRLPEAEPDQLALVLGSAGLAARAAELGALLERVAELPLDLAMRGPYFGFSVTVDAGGRALAAAFGTAAHCLAGSDARVRERLLAVAAERGWQMDGYAAASAPLVTLRPERQPRHGVLVLVAPAAGPLGLQIGLTPPPAVRYPAPS
jgi:hypothetical protein